MPFDDLAGAARLVQRIDEMLAMAKSWPPANRAGGFSSLLRSLTWDDVLRFDALDAKIGGLMKAIGVSLPPPLNPTRSRGTRGYTEIHLLSNYSADFPSEWSRRLESLRNAMEEILDVADYGEKTSQRFPDNEDVRDLCRLLEKNRTLRKPLPLIEVARQHTKEKPGKDRKSQALMRQARRFRELWDGTDK